jgi:hypothetical protein
MQELEDYTKDCLDEHAEWKADERAAIRSNHNITYPKHDYLVRPRSWDALDEPGNGLPHIIEGSRPLRPGLKRRRYRNSRATHNHATYYRTSQPRPPPEPEQSDATSGIPPHPTTLRIGRHNNNSTDKPTQHTNSCITPYSDSRLRPPPWPNKNPTKNRNKYYYGTHTPTGTTTKRRPPPWPIIPTPTTILSISNSRPPPWPIICHCQHNQHSPVSSPPPARPPPWPIIPRHIHSTSQNRRNAKQRVKAKSRIILDEVSV